MQFTSYNISPKQIPQLAFSLILISVLSISDAVAQDWRFSAGYSIQRYGLEITPNPDYLGDISFTQKGVLELELEKYFAHHIYLSGNGGVLINNSESAFHGGPINFNRTSIGLNLGLQWNRLGLYTGVHGAYSWNMNFRGYSTDDYDSSIYWIESDKNDELFSGGFTVGAKYYLLNFFRLHAEIKSHHYSQHTIRPNPDSPYIPTTSEIQFRPVTVSLGFSISIPWHSKSKLEKYNSGSRSSPLMSVSGLQIQSPMERSIVTSPFGYRWGRPHEGIDLDADRGDQVLSAADGVVEETSYSASYGRKIVIRHGREYTSTYAHLNEISVQEGDRVRRGQVIGQAGNSGNVTGVHLHFEIRKNGHPVDPQDYIRF
ncbi:peptidoglycan DD-metalloendopeptidase family protein [Rhodohalobacter barkolensis]|uniref:M23ase beta-sheet core domain-containing protein n=1 Tax=Rhodohalobacter barkolensis TaxID=2053187 RepID=A0A2N0VLB0_9BACT|nr:peptidoglycan DD-metalloendopeptidase family protein [Rhodohalobacter barkolensis]PKD44993.1 hypothetical protein CWD77_05915 [Rhodohalobacter barkolensis]